MDGHLEDDPMNQVWVGRPAVCGEANCNSVFEGDDDGNPEGQIGRKHGEKLKEGGGDTE